ncbi:MAG: flagellar hook-basal body complex protein [Mariprofundales bacterium]|nr:flagellar hook-basal body complex protein [Mariprofundales bacterium]
MGMFGSLYTSKSGMIAFSEGTNVISNNLANTNTLGFKSNTVLFSDVMNQAASGSSINAAGRSSGVQLAKIGRDMQQGQIKDTTSGTDMAISGRGMFALKDPISGNSYYSRAGSFSLDKSFNLVNGQGMVLQGWQKDATGATISTTPVDINIGKFSGASPAALAQNQIVIPATASTSVTVGSTLAASAQRPSTVTFDANDPTSYNFKTDATLYDANGNKHIASLFFVKQGQDAAGSAVWDWHMAVKGDQIIGGSASDANTLVEVGGSSLLAADTLPAGTLPAGTTIGAATTLSAAITSQFTLIDQSGNSATIPASGSNSWQANSTLSSVAAANGLANTGFYRIGSGGMVTPTATVGGSNALIQLPATSSTVTNGVVDPAAASSQRLEFDGSGALINEYSPTLTTPWSGGVAAGAITVDLGAATTLDAQGVTGSGLNGVTQVGSSFAANIVSSDGFAQGTLDRLETDGTGVIHGIFTNGRRIPLAQVALAGFGNPSALERIGDNMLRASSGSGTATLLTPTSSGMGTIVGSGLEQSNVDLGNEFVKLIILQRGYEANSKSLTTTDQMLTLLAQLKR